MRLVEQHCTSHSSPCFPNTGMNGSFGKFGSSALLVLLACFIHSHS